MSDLYTVPMTMEGSYALHQIFKFHSSSWHHHERFHRDKVMAQAAALLSRMEEATKEGRPNQSALYSLMGHKGDLMLVHFRNSLEDLHRAELAIRHLEFSDFLESTYSFLSVVELGLYESSAKTYAQLQEQGIQPHTPEWDAAIKDVLTRQSAAMAPRLYPEIPKSRYICFYPMDRKRGESKNWYSTPLADRQRMMARTWHGGSPLRRFREANHQRFHRPGRLGMGCRSLCRRSSHLQTPHLRNALR